MHADLSASWIWFDAGRTENVFARARRTFDLDSVPERAEILVTCSGLYRLWINGEFAGRGPARSLPWKKRYDVLDIAPFLRKGKNVLALGLVHFGYATALVAESPGGLWCQTAVGGARVESDAEWLFSRNPCYNPNTGRRNGCYGIIEEYDARLEEKWRSVDFDDSSWSPATVLRDPRSGHAGPRTSPWTDLIPRGVPQCAEESLRPQAVVRLAEVEDREITGANLAWQLLQDTPLEPEYTRIERPESLVTGRGGPMVVTQPSPLDRESPVRRCATIILDFGREISAFGRLDVEGNEGAIVDVAYGERLIAGRVQAVVQGTGYADRYILGNGRRRHEVYDWKGYRYVQLTFRELTGPLEVHGVGATFYRYPLEPVGEFDCSDEKLSRVWQVGAYTQQLCTVDSLMDTPWREQQQWLGDGRLQLLVLQNAFGERAMARKFIEQFAEAQGPDGMVPCVSMRPGRYIVDYALWWVQGVLDVLRFDGDIEFAARFVPNIERLFAWFAPFERADGLLENVPGWVFIDWANVGKEGLCAPLNAIYSLALAAAAEIAERTARKPLAGEWRRKAGLIEGSFHRTFFDPGRGLYADNVLGGERTESFSQHTQSIAVVAGIAETDVTELMRRTLSDANLVRTEPYFSFYLLEALAEAGLAAEAVSFTRDKWGAMLEAGATSFWEEWQVTGTFRGGRWLPRPRSHCHAWSAGPTAYLSRHVLGVRADDLDGPVLIAPEVAGLERAEGIVPTRYGPIRVGWAIEDGRLRVEAELSPDVPVEFRPPAEFQGKADFVRRG